MRMPNLRVEKDMFTLMDGKDFEFEECGIAESIGLAFHGLDLLLVPSKGPVEMR